MYDQFFNNSFYSTGFKFNNFFRIRIRALEPEVINLPGYNDFVINVENNFVSIDAPISRASITTGIYRQTQSFGRSDPNEINIRCYEGKNDEIRNFFTSWLNLIAPKPRFGRSVTMPYPDSMKCEIGIDHLNEQETVIGSDIYLRATPNQINYDKTSFDTESETDIMYSILRFTYEEHEQR